MNPGPLIIGFVPLVLFALLDGRIPVADAAAIAAALALIIVAVTARRGVPVLPIVQVITLITISVIAFASGPPTQVFLTDYGRGLASLVLAAYMLVTAPFAPFTASIARAGVPREVSTSRRFIELNQRISAAWGLAVLVLGLAHLAGAAIGPSLPPFRALLLEWGPAIVAVICALRYTQRTVAAAQPR
ncbi:MAG TPA: hypothetical protein VHZ97_18065 [Pseudonocardiaceae bacterium]|jgi:hypothetical protein|nr:hypothetical protein [Pseudonocardiaceae bacterium]